MHECPECYQACCCHGDIDSSDVLDPEFVADHCDHDCEDIDDDDDDYLYDELDFEGE